MKTIIPGLSQITLGYVNAFLLEGEAELTLIAADAATNLVRLGYPPIFEDFEVGRETLRSLATAQFEVAVFGHGKPITARASERFRERWRN